MTAIGMKFPRSEHGQSITMADAGPQAASGVRAAPAELAAAFAAGYDATVDQVYAYLFARCGRRAQVAEDLTQEVYLAAVVAVRRGAPDAMQIPWLIGVARHKLVDHYRQDQRRHRNLRIVTELYSRNDDVARWRDGETDGPLLDALESLPALQRGALVLRHVDGLPVPDVAAGLGRSVRATESILSRARSALRACYSEVRRD